MHHFLIFLRFIRFLFRSGNEHAIHSPFVFHFYTTVVARKKNYYAFSKIEEIRNNLRTSNEKVCVTDLGAGSRTIAFSSSKRTISSIVKTSLKPERICHFLFRTVAYLQPNYIFELGTSLGITTLYLSKAKKDASVISFEGCPELSRIARLNLIETKCKNTTVITGDLNHILRKKLEFYPRVDFVFFDANHLYDPTLEYFYTCMSKAHENSVFVFDDIHWSGGMERAWDLIRKLPEVSVSIDFFFVGVVFFRKEQPKEHFYLRL